MKIKKQLTDEELIRKWFYFDVTYFVFWFTIVVGVVTILVTLAIL